MTSHLVEDFAAIYNYFAASVIQKDVARDKKEVLMEVPIQTSNLYCGSQLEKLINIPKIGQIIYGRTSIGHAAEPFHREILTHLLETTLKWFQCFRNTFLKWCEFKIFNF